MPSSPAALGSEQWWPRDPPPPPPASGNEGACPSPNLAPCLGPLPIPTPLCRHSRDPVEICPEILGAESGGLFGGPEKRRMLTLICSERKLKPVRRLMSSSEQAYAAALCTVRGFSLLWVGRMGVGSSPEFAARGLRNVSAFEPRLVAAAFTL